MVENPPSGGGDEVVVMGFEWKKVEDGETFDFSSGTMSGNISETIKDTESAWEWHDTSLGIMVTTGYECDDLILFRFYRDTTNGNDTYENNVGDGENDAWLGIYHLEYLSDSLGDAS